MQVPSEAGCVEPGVPIDGCGAGFEHDGDHGCSAIMPSTVCPRGTFAVPGETACHPPASCLDASFSGVAVDATTQYVDAAYTGGNSDGSATRPWRTIAEAVTAAANDAIVAVGEGTYAEDVQLDKPVRIWGRCPELVSIDGQSAQTAVHVAAAAGGSELHNVAITGPAGGVLVAGATNVIIEGVWVHDTAGIGIQTAPLGILVGVTVRQTLVERASELGIGIVGGTAVIEETAVRDTAPNPADMRHGRGVEIVEAPMGPATVASLRSVVVERNHDLGVAIGGATVTIDSVLVRDMLPQASDQLGGRGVNVQPIWWANDPQPTRGNLTLTRSVVERSVDLGLFVAGSDANVEHTVIRDTMPIPDGRFGRGLDLEAVDYFVSPSDTEPILTDSAALVLRGSLVDRSVDVGVLVSGSRAGIEGVLVRATDKRNLTETYGDGISVTDAQGLAADATVSGTLVIDSARAGIGLWGSVLSVGTTVLECNAFDVAIEPGFDGTASSLNDGGENACGCNQVWAPCQAVSTSLTAPLPVQ